MRPARIVEKCRRGIDAEPVRSIGRGTAETQAQRCDIRGGRADRCDADGDVLLRLVLRRSDQPPRPAPGEERGPGRNQPGLA